MNVYVLFNGRVIGTHPCPYRDETRVRRFVNKLRYDWSVFTVDLSEFEDFWFGEAAEEVNLLEGEE